MRESQKTVLANMEQAITEMIGDYLTDHKEELRNAGFEDNEDLHIAMAKSAVTEFYLNSKTNDND